MMNLNVKGGPGGIFSYGFQVSQPTCVVAAVLVCFAIRTASILQNWTADILAEKKAQIQIRKNLINHTVLDWFEPLNNDCTLGGVE